VNVSAEFIDIARTRRVDEAKRFGLDRSCWPLVDAVSREIEDKSSSIVVIVSGCPFRCPRNQHVKYVPSFLLVRPDSPGSPAHMIVYIPGLLASRGDGSASSACSGMLRLFAAISRYVHGDIARIAPCTTSPDCMLRCVGPPESGAAVAATPSGVRTLVPTSKEASRIDDLALPPSLHLCPLCMRKVMAIPSQQAVRGRGGGGGAARHGFRASRGGDTMFDPIRACATSRAALRAWASEFVRVRSASASASAESAGARVPSAELADESTVADGKRFRAAIACLKDDSTGEFSLGLSSRVWFREMGEYATDMPG